MGSRHALLFDVSYELLDDDTANQKRQRSDGNEGDENERDIELSVEAGADARPELSRRYPSLASRGSENQRHPEREQRDSRRENCPRGELGGVGEDAGFHVGQHERVGTVVKKISFMILSAPGIRPPHRRSSRFVDDLLIQLQNATRRLKD